MAISCISPVSELSILLLYECVIPVSYASQKEHKICTSTWVWGGGVFNNGRKMLNWGFIFFQHLILQALKIINCKTVFYNALCGHMLKSPDLLIMHLSLNFRCPTHRQGGVVCSEAAPVLCTVWLCDRSSQRPQVQRGEASWTEWDGGVHHTQSWCSYWMHLPRGCHYGESAHTHLRAHSGVFRTLESSRLSISILYH